MEGRTLEFRIRIRAEIADPGEAQDMGISLDSPITSEASRFAVMQALLNAERNGFPRETPEAEALAFEVLSTEAVEDDPRDALLRRLYAWGRQMGGWEAPVWDDLASFVESGSLSGDSLD